MNFFSLLVQLCGIIVGHLYYFLVFKYPQDFDGVNFLQTPSFLYVLLSFKLKFICLFLFFCRYRFFPNEQTGISGFGAAPIPRRQPGTENNDGNRIRQLFGGRGHVLGEH